MPPIFHAAMPRRSHRTGRWYRLAVGWLLTIPSTAAQSAADTCAPRGEPAIVAAIRERAEILLKDGRTLKLAGIDVAHATTDHPELGELPGKTLQTWLVNHPVTVEPVGSNGPDRWGRIVANVYAPSEFGTLPGPEAPAEPDLSVALVLVDAGLARARPSPEKRTCMPSLLAAEATARQARMGLWNDPFYAVIAADDEMKLAQHGGLFVVVEGEVNRVGKGRARTFLDFGPTRDSFTAVVGQRKRRGFDPASLMVDALQGKRLRVRGTLDIRFGPRIEVMDADEIERL